MGTSFTGRTNQGSSRNRILRLCRRRGHVRGLDGHQGGRPAPDRAAGAGALHATRVDASGKAMALGSDGGSLRASRGAAGLCCVNAEALPSPDLRIVSGVSAGNRGGLRRVAAAAGGAENLREEKSAEPYTCPANQKSTHVFTGLTSILRHMEVSVSVLASGSRGN